ncbi:MAG: OmpA family protein [Pseudomonadota bacterium]
MKYWLFTGGLALIALVACSQGAGDFLTGAKWDVDKAAETSVPDDPLLGALHQTYVAHARFEETQSDWETVADYIARIRMVSGGEVPPMRDLDALGINEADLPELSATKNEITALMARRGVRLRAGAELGAAHGNFDCWAEQAEEGHQDEDISRCRDATLGAIDQVKSAAELPKSWVVVLPEDGEIGGISLSDGTNEILLDGANAAASADGTVARLPVDLEEISEVFGDAQAAAPEPATLFTLTFDTGSAEIDSPAFEQILQAAADVRSRNEAGVAAEILITGHADAVGGDRANFALSETRARRVAKAVFDELRATEGGKFSLLAKGELDLAVPTPRPDVRNRRVTILVR